MKRTIKDVEYHRLNFTEYDFVELECLAVYGEKDQHIPDELSFKVRLKLFNWQFNGDADNFVIDAVRILSEKEFDLDNTTVEFFSSNSNTYCDHIYLTDSKKPEKNDLLCLKKALAFVVRHVELIRSTTDSMVPFVEMCAKLNCNNTETNILYSQHTSKCGIFNMSIYAQNHNNLIEEFSIEELERYFCSDVIQFVLKS